MTTELLKERQQTGLMIQELQQKNAWLNAENLRMHDLIGQCFHLENGQFCGHAEDWEGHAAHDFIPFSALLSNHIRIFADLSIMSERWEMVGRQLAEVVRQRDEARELAGWTHCPTVKQQEG